MSGSLCNTCKKAITTTAYVKCYNCNANYHFSPCCPLSEATYSNMYGERKTNWKCQICRPRTKSSNNLYQAIVFEEKDQRKARNDDEKDCEGNRANLFKEPSSLNTVNSTLCSVECNVNDLKSDIKNINTKLEDLAASVNNSHIQIKDELKYALSTITNTLSKLVDEVKDLTEKDKQRENQIHTLESRINKIEQQYIAKNIEIKHITNKEMTPNEIIKTISASVDVEVSDADISNADRLKKQDDKVVVEFTSISKKRELMSKITRHRLDAHVINNNQNASNPNKYIYINDQLTFNNRRLLWITKNKAREANWKYVWVRDGKIFARKTDNSPSMIINNAIDSDLITPTVN